MAERSSSGAAAMKRGRNEKTSNDNMLPCNIIIVAGTYDGVLAAWEMKAKKKKKLALTLASPVHDGSVRSLSIAAAAAQTAPSSSKISKPKKESKRMKDSAVVPIQPGVLLSCGYDEVLRTHDFSKRLTSSGEVRTPAEFGTPVCSCFAPPAPPPSLSGKNSISSYLPSTHCLVGFSGGKLVIYKKKDWVVQHVLAGHEGGVAAVAVHPSGKLALSGGTSDGKLKLWDLTRGRLAFVSKIHPAATSVQGRTHYDPVVSIVWSYPNSGEVDNVDAYAVAYGSHVTVRAVDTGKDLLDVELPSRVNQICLVNDPCRSDKIGLFVAAACNDGSLPVLAVQGSNNSTGSSAGKERPAIMAIEPVDGPVAREERFKCITTLSGCHVVTANSAGVVSVMNLQGAIDMIRSNEDQTEDGNATSSSSAADEERPVNPESDDEDDNDDAETSSDELAVDIIDSIQLGTGARITCLAAWCSHDAVVMEEEEEDDDDIDGSEAAAENLDQSHEKAEQERDAMEEKALKRKRGTDSGGGPAREITMDQETLDKARSLVAKAKKLQKRRERKKQKKQKTSG